MQWVRNLQTSAKIIGLVLIMAVFMSVVGYTGYKYLQKANETTNDMYQNNLLPIKWINAARSNTRAAEAVTLELLLANDPSKQQEHLKEINSRTEEVNKLLSDYEKTDMTPSEKEKYAEMKKELAAYREQSSRFIQLALEGKQAEALQGFHAASATLDKVNGALQELADSNDKSAEEKKAQNEANAAAANKILLATILATVALAVVLGWFIARMIAHPLTKVADIANRVSEGDLNVESLRIDSKDEIGQLASAVNKMVENLRNLIREVKETAEHVASSAEELSATSEQTGKAAEQIALTIQEVASGAEKQVHSVEESSKIISEMSSGVHQIANNAQNVTVASQKAAEVAQEGNRAIHTAVKQMSSINQTVTELAAMVKGLGDRSREIGQIVEVITAIAEQTNLLALNAAIEAARAGEHGRGFAVVADEVRKLAEQSAHSAQQIAELIGNIQNETAKAVQSMEKGTGEVATGIEVVNSAGHSFEQIQRSVNDVAAQIEQVSAAVEEMSAGSEQMVQSVRLITEIAETTATGTQNVSAATEEQLASMEEISASASSLANAAERLQNLVATFKS